MDLQDCESRQFALSVESSRSGSNFQFLRTFSSRGFGLLAVYLRSGEFPALDSAVATATIRL